MKQCRRCKELQEENNFGKCRKYKDNLDTICKRCRHRLYKKDKVNISLKSSLYYLKNKEKKAEYSKVYQQLNKETISNVKKEHYLLNKDAILEKNRKYYSNNKEAIIERHHIDYINNRDVILSKKKKYTVRGAVYNTYAYQLTVDEEPRLAEDGISLQVKCRYCGKYFTPTNSAVRHRLKSLVTDTNGISYLYCSEECKDLCPVYRRREWPKGLAPTTSREVDPLVRKLCFETDNWECQRCGSTEALICHHILGYAHYKTLGNDLANTITFCKGCHQWVHSFKGCRYVDLQCKIGDISS